MLQAQNKPVPAIALTLGQFAPQVGDVDNNLNRADAVLSKANPQNLDILVLPELAFSGMLKFRVSYYIIHILPTV
jgi:predicted amidohydrolase